MYRFIFRFFISNVFFKATPFRHVGARLHGWCYAFKQPLILPCEHTFKGLLMEYLISKEPQMPHSFIYIYTFIFFKMLQFYCTHVPYPLWIWILKLNFLNSSIFEFYPLFLAPKQFLLSCNQPPVDLSRGQCLFNNIQWIVHLSHVGLLRLIAYLKFFQLRWVDWKSISIVCILLYNYC